MAQIVKLFKRLAVIQVCIVLFISCFILLGWFFYESPIKNVFPGNQLSNPVTSVCFIVACLAFLGVINKEKKIRRAGFLLAFIMILVVFLKLLEVSSISKIHVDKWLFTNKLTLNSNMGQPNFMAPNTAVTFFILGISLLLFRYKIINKNILSDYFATGVSLISFISLLGFLYQAFEFYQASKYIPMALPTAISFFLLSLSILFIRSEFGFVSILTTKYEGSKAALFLIPFAILIPTITGLVRVYGEQIGLYSAGFGVALFATINIVLFLFIIWRAVLYLNKASQTLTIQMEEKIATEKKLLESRQLLQSVIDNTSAFIYVKDVQGKYILVNGTYSNFFGFSKSDFINKTIFDLTDYDIALQLKLQDEQVIEKDQIIENEQQISIAGDLRDLYSVRFPIKNAAGITYAIGGIVTDITQIKKQSHLINDLYEHAPVGYYSINTKGKFINANITTLQWLGYKKEELLGKNILEIMAPECHEEFKRSFPIFKKQGYINEKEFIYTRKDGTVFNVLLNASAVKTEFGDFLYSRSSIFDITERKKLEEEINISREKFLKLFYASPLAMMIRNIEDGKIFEVNREYERMFGYKKEEVVGTTTIGSGILLNDVSSDDIKKIATEKKALKNIEATIYSKQNKPLNVLVSMERIILENKECILTGIVDITERKKLEENLSLINKELESFTYSVSHDLRAPLRIINGYAELITNENNGTLNEDAKRMLGNIMINAKRMGMLIDDLLNFSRLGRKELVIHKTDMNVLVKSVAQEQLNSVDRSKYKIIIHTLPFSYCDSSLIKQVWENLLSNAIKYSAKNPAPTIEIGSIQENYNIVYFIKDNGAGFDMKYYDQLFGVFQRLHKQSEFEGTGVGLALTQRIITKHGGKIWAESKINKGTAFYFNLKTDQ